MSVSPIIWYYKKQVFACNMFVITYILENSLPEKNKTNKKKAGQLISTNSVD